MYLYFFNGPKTFNVYVSKLQCKRPRMNLAFFSFSFLFFWTRFSDALACCTMVPAPLHITRWMHRALERFTSWSHTANSGSRSLLTSADSCSSSALMDGATLRPLNITQLTCSRESSCRLETITLLVLLACLVAICAVKGRDKIMGSSHRYCLVLGVTKPPRPRYALGPCVVTRSYLFPLDYNVVFLRRGREDNKYTLLDSSE